MAQNYSYDNFCTDIKNSDMKSFSITDILNLLGTEPFLLEEFQVETVIIYIFETEHPTGEESLSSKDFIKKMKRFIGKAKNIDENQEHANIEKLSKLIEKDENGPGKLRKKFIESDEGDGTITLEQFSKVMSDAKIKDSLL